MITAEFINEVHDALIPHFRDIPFGNAAWSTFYDDEDYGHFRLRLALCYGSTFKYETFDEGDDDSRTLDEVVEEWKQAIIEATTTNLIDYKGTHLLSTMLSERLYAIPMAKKTSNQLSSTNSLNYVTNCISNNRAYPLQRADALLERYQWG